MEEIPSLAHLKQLIQTEEAVLVYFSTQDCNVCKVLKPKLEGMIRDKFPGIKTVYAEITKHPEVAGVYQIYTVPVVVVYFHGREYLRKSRVFGYTTCSLGSVV